MITNDAPTAANAYKHPDSRSARRAAYRGRAAVRLWCPCLDVLGEMHDETEARDRVAVDDAHGVVHEERRQQQREREDPGVIRGATNGGAEALCVEEQHVQVGSVDLDCLHKHT